MATRKQTMVTAASALLGFFGGLVHGSTSPGFQQRFPSWAKSAPEPTIEYATLDCPSDEEYRKIAARLHLEVPAGLDVCKDKNHSRLAKLMHFTANLAVHIPSGWAPEIREDLSNPIDFLSRSATKMAFDFTQSESVAYNKEKEIFLGGIFFNEHPMEGLSTLVHEARHSSEFDPGHVECRRGDIPKASGGCDQALSTEMKKAGAYSYGAAFYAALGLYAEALPKADREYLLSASLATISNRFNVLPVALAQAYDVVAILNRAGNVSLLHPFHPEPVPLIFPEGMLKTGERVERIELNVRNSGLLLFTNEQRAFTWVPEGGFTRLYGSSLPEGLHILDAARVRVPFNDYPFYNFLTGSHEIQYYHFNASQNAYELAQYPTFPDHQAVPELSRIFMGLGARSMFLGKQGQIFVGQRFGGDPAFDSRADLQVAGRSWSNVTGGVVFESLYGVLDDGKVQFTTTEYAPANDDSGYDEEVYTVADSTFQAPGSARAKKILEGLTFRAILDSEGSLSFEAYDSRFRSSWKGNDVVDFAILRNHFTGGRLVSDGGAEGSFVDTCQLHDAIADPWMGIGFGLDTAGRLVVGAPGANPCMVVSETKYSSLKLKIPAQKRARDNKERKSLTGGTEALQRNVLFLTKQGGGIEILKPYEYRN